MWHHWVSNLRLSRPEGGLVSHPPRLQSQKLIDVSRSGNTGRVAFIKLLLAHVVQKSILRNWTDLDEETRDSRNLGQSLCFCAIARARPSI